MPRNMSFALTMEQILAETKTETRRVGWERLAAGDTFWACEKCQGLKRGEKMKRLKLLRCISNYQEELRQIDKAGVDREGFPGMTPNDFVEMFCRHMKVSPRFRVNVIRFEYVK